MKSDKILMKYMDRNIYSDCLKTIAVLLIILCHVSGNGIYVILFIAGYYFNKTQIDKKYRIVIYLLGALGYFITVIGTYKMSSSTNIVDIYYYDFASPNVVCMALAVFIWFKNIHWVDIFSKSYVLAKSIYELSTASYWIYLVHYMIIEILLLKFSGLASKTPIMFLLLMLTLTLILSYITAKIISLVKKCFKLVLSREKHINIKYDSLRA